MNTTVGVSATRSPRTFIAPPKIGRNELCPCDSGKKFKKCHGVAEAGPLPVPEEKFFCLLLPRRGNRAVTDAGGLVKVWASQEKARVDAMFSLRGEPYVISGMSDEQWAGFQQKVRYTLVG